MFEFPDPVLLALAVLGEGLLDQNDIRQVLVGFLEFFDSADIRMLEVIAEYSVVEV